MFFYQTINKESIIFLNNKKQNKIKYFVLDKVSNLLLNIFLIIFKVNLVFFW